MRPALAAIASMLASPALAHAHGGLGGPSEVGPPIMTSIALAFVCYWVVILWPASKRGDHTAGGANGSQSRNGDRARARTMAKSGVAKQRAQLRTAGANGRLEDEANARRKAIDA
ncbi:MAG: hypothetical protein Q7S58_12920 [Candidatus Binatus sp.]|uniref:hypothetical protein n=1 Tax=Candidatus Binatus sp. TaxID=2811406 RepID=UPI0027185AED|nr:hypothetical protein [Candidatus Binatus sp.]MDO8433302.1 hypothetical protein [Candidatus Binatus sp.]